MWTVGPVADVAREPLNGGVGENPFTVAPAVAARATEDRHEPLDCERCLIRSAGLRATNTAVSLTRNDSTIGKGN